MSQLPDPPSHSTTLGRQLPHYPRHRQPDVSFLLTPPSSLLPIHFPLFLSPFPSSPITIFPMPTNYFSPQVVCRPALPSDAPAVLEFTKFIWGGHDYIKYVWDDWLADPHGILAVAEYAGRAVALGKV